MPKFEKRFVHFMWSDELEGKKVLYSDNMMLLIKYVNDGDTDELGIVSYSSDDELPFRVDGDCWRFVYYDPYYNLKVAFEQGKMIQGKHGLTGEWIDIEATNINWEMYELEGIELRVKPEETKPITNRELARWLARGNGEFTIDELNRCCYEHRYDPDNENEQVSAKFLIRKWEDEEWHLPTREYMGLEE